MVKNKTKASKLLIISTIILCISGLSFFLLIFPSGAAPSDDLKNVLLISNDEYGRFLESLEVDERDYHN